MEQLNEIIKTSSEALPRKQPEQKRPYISQQTWTLLERKWEAIENGDDDTANQLSQEIKERAKKDKEAHLLEELEEITNQGYKWDGLKKMRAKFTPNFTKFKDLNGKHVPCKQYAHKAAEYLEKVQWKAQDNQHQKPDRENSPLQDGRYVIDDSDFTLVELDYVLCRVKKNKMAGNDGIPGELYKWLDDENKKLLLHAANVCLRQGTMDPHHLNAVVVSIYKKGDASKLENYRPISLLTACYKIVAALLKERLDKGLDKWLMATQYGFRKGKSTSQAIFAARRLQDISEKSKSHSTLILLDWEKAFDKVAHDKCWKL